MEAKLKALKVVDLKEILNRASVSIPSKSNKNDLITRILASSAALDAYNAQYSPKPAEKAPEKPVVQQEQPSQADASLKPPSSTQSQPSAATLPGIKPTPSAAPEAPTAIYTPLAAEVPVTSTPKPTADEKLEKRKARAARFGLPLVEPAKPTDAKMNKPAKLAGTASDDPEKLAARAARFGTTQAAVVAQPVTQSNGRKRNAPPVEAVDAEELERRRKRAERFGIPVVGTKA